jgi:hypothetical protein
MRTERVLRPKVASMSVLRSRASCTMRLIGADSGLIMATTLQPITMLPNPIFNKLKFIASPSFDILHLFANFFDFVFQLQDIFRHVGVVGLRANRIDFPVHFLNEEIELAAYVAVLLQKAL